MAGFVTPMQQMGGGMPMGVKHPNEGGSEDEPSNKKLRNEDSLIPEEVFLARNAVSYYFLFILLQKTYILLLLDFVAIKF